MATKKKLLQAAAGSAGGAGGLNVEDVFSTYLYEGNGTSHVIDNEINLGQSYGSGGIDTSLKATSAVVVNGSADFGYGTGDFTIELWVWINKLYDFINIWDQRTATQDSLTATPIIYSSDAGAIFYYQSGNTRISSGNGALTNGAWNHVALTRNGGSTKLFVDGTQVGSTYSDSANYVTPASDWSFGGSLEQGRYNLDGYVSNARVVKGTAVYTGNFTVPTSELTNITNTVLLTAQGSTPLVDNSSSSHTVTAYEGAKASTFGPFDAADAGEGGLVWLKNRSGTANHILSDTERGANSQLRSDVADTASTSTTRLTSFNSNGFTIGSSSTVNTASDDYASWTWRKAPRFFDCVTYTGDGNSSQTISHNLDAEVGCIFVKALNQGTWNWRVYHRSQGAGLAGYLDTTSNFVATSVFPSTHSTTDFTVGVGTWEGLNYSGEQYVAYLFAHNDGDGEFGPTGDQDIIKCGSFTVGGSGTSVPVEEIDLGFEPQWVFLKRTDGGNAAYQEWRMMDTMRGASVAGNYQAIYANDNAPEFTESSAYMYPTSTGFNAYFPGNASYPGAGASYIYIAIRRGPMAVPTDATEVFDIAFDGALDNNEPYIRTSLSYVDAVINNSRSNPSNYHRLGSRLTQGLYLNTNSTSAETSDSFYKYDYQNGWMGISASNSVNTNGISWMWKRAPSFCDVVAYTGNGTAGRTVSHNLGVVPEMIWVKGRAFADNWAVWHKDLGSNQYLQLNVAAAAGTNSNIFPATAPTESVFSVGQDGSVNDSGNPMIAYLFASLDGVSKVGSYTGNGSSQTIDCGFSSGARFVLIKGNDLGYDWLVFDTERGIVSGNDARLHLNNTSAESSGNDWIDPASSGFTVTSEGEVNNSGTEYIFYAIA